MLTHPGSPTADHPDLEGEKLVEREASECGVTSLEARRIVRLLDGLADVDERRVGADARREVFRIRGGRGIEGTAHRAPERCRSQSCGEPIDRHDPAGVQQCRAVVGLEFRVIERHPVAESPQLAADHDRVADLQASLDEAPPEPRGIQAPGLVLEPRDRALHATPERGLNAQLADPYARRNHLAIGHGAEIANAAHLAQVLITARDPK